MAYFTLLMPHQLSQKTPWFERDKAIRKGEAALNNQNVKKYSADPPARFVSKGKSKFWFGYFIERSSYTC